MSQSTSQSNIIWNAKDAAQATQGTLTGSQDWSVTGISIDTRTLQKGDLFVALGGPYHDGHDYVIAALQQGAGAVMISHDVTGLPSDAPVLFVRDTRRALEDLAKTARYRMSGTVIGITGSVGKTGVKNMLAAVFGDQGQTHAAKASHNNHWGVPLTLAGTHEGTDYGIYEMGMNHAGEIALLTKMVRPNIALITTIAPAHIENLGSMEGIADAKAEIFQGLQAGGTAVLNRDNAWYDRLFLAATLNYHATFSFGEHESADIRMTNIIEASNGSRITFTLNGVEYQFTLPMVGKHHALNALGVLACVHLAGADINKAINTLSQHQAGDGRGRFEKIALPQAPQNPITLIDESYNASPDSMRAAFRVLALIDPGKGGRRIAILGDMLELGVQSARYHGDLALPIKAAGIDLVYTCGAMMKNLHDTLPQSKRGAHADTSAQLAEIVLDAIVPGDVIMIKGSNSTKMGVIVEALRQIPRLVASSAQDTSAPKTASNTENTNASDQQNNKGNLHVV
jgi:UDP-N-acetylmuramoyl-tripeptide--D-alanyl-D-alanine ligase